jgi:hypothetical protein
VAGTWSSWSSTDPRCLPGDDASPEYQAISHLRTEALAKGELHPMDPGGELP